MALVEVQSNTCGWADQQQARLFVTVDDTNDNITAARVVMPPNHSCRLTITGQDVPGGQIVQVFTSNNAGKISPASSITFNPPVPPTSQYSVQFDCI